MLAPSNLYLTFHRSLLGLAILICAHSAFGDTTERRGEVHFQPDPAEAALPEMYRLKAASFAFQEKPVPTTATGYKVWELTFSSPVETAFEVNNTVHGEYFCPVRPGKHPAAIVLHILGGDFDLSRLFARQLAQSGVAALFIKLPYYGPRRPEGIKMRMVSEDPRETVAGMRQAILDIRRGVAWLAAQEEVDAERLGVFGISLGGITGALALAIEPKLKMGCLMLAGGDVAKVAWENERLAKIRERWLSQGGSKEEFFELWKSIDPVTYADRARGKRMLMLNATHDEIIPPACTQSLWRALGEPEIVWYEAGHITAGRFLFDGLGRVTRFFQSAR
jgi:dienelactone hydrolase